MKPMIGQKYHRWTLKAFAGTDSKYRSRWLCLCDCGIERIVDQHSFTSGNSRSCGCLKIEEFRARRFKHGMKRSRVYNIWSAMIQRCSDRNYPAFRDYGGRGIVVCDRWRDFRDFYADMGMPPKGQTLERIDNDGPYAQDNCRWASRKEQANNRRSNRLIEYAGEIRSLAMWASTLGINASTLAVRINRGMAPSEAIVLALKGQRKPTVACGQNSPQAKLTDDQARNVMERYQIGNITQTALAKEFGVSQAAIWSIVNGRRKEAVMNRL